MRSETETGSSQTRAVLKVGVSRTLTPHRVVSLGRQHVSTTVKVPQHVKVGVHHVKVGVHHQYLLHPTWEKNAWLCQESTAGAFSFNNALMGPQRHGVGDRREKQPLLLE